MNFVLYDEQERAVTLALAAFQAREADRFKCPYRYLVNFSDAGVGKSIETVVCIRRLGLPETEVLILCPKTLKKQWKDYLPEAEIQTYESWRNNGELKQYACVVLDEFHKLKNRHTKITEKVWQLRRKHPNTLFIGLTATPIRNQPTDMWSILHVIGAFGQHPLYNGWTAVKESYWAFCNRYYRMKDNGFTKVFLGYNEERFDELMDLINFRVAPIRGELQLQVGLNRILVECDMQDWQRTAYQQVKKLVYEQLPEDVKISNALVQLLRLIQLTTCPKCVSAEYDYGCKFETLRLLMLQGTIPQDVLIFSRFNTALQWLHKYLGIKRPVYNGQLSVEQRSNILKDFQTTGGILLATIGAAGTGLDGLQESTHSIVFLDRDWSPNINYQAEARLYRTGQQKDVTVYEFQVKHSIDQYIERLTEKKELDFRQLMQEILCD